MLSLKVTRNIYYIIAMPVILVFFAGLFIMNPVLKMPAKIRENIKASRENLYSTVEYLVSAEPPRNFRNTDSLDSTAAYIAGKFREYGYMPETQEFSAGKHGTYRNILCSMGPRGGERVILGAHYDVCGDQPGADDNASAVAGLLEVARLMKPFEGRLRYRLDFAAYTLEEPPYFKTCLMGSYIHAKSLHDMGVKVRAMVCLEMIGYFSDEPGSQTYPNRLLGLFYPDTGDFIGVVGRTWQRKLVRDVKKYMIQGSGIKVKSINAPKFIPGIEFSDHLNYWKFGYPAVMITDTAFYRNYNYHSAEDTIEKLDFAGMEEVVKGVFHAVRSLAAGE